MLTGLSTDWGKSTVALYQNEINNLQKMVKETLMMTSLPLTPPDTPDPVCSFSYLYTYICLHICSCTSWYISLHVFTM